MTDEEQQIIIDAFGEDTLAAKLFLAMQSYDTTPNGCSFLKYKGRSEIIDMLKEVAVQERALKTSCEQAADRHLCPHDEVDKCGIVAAGHCEKLKRHIEKIHFPECGKCHYDSAIRNARKEP